MAPTAPLATAAGPTPRLADNLQVPPAEIKTQTHKAHLSWCAAGPRRCRCRCRRRCRCGAQALCPGWAVAPGLPPAQPPHYSPAPHTGCRPACTNHGQQQVCMRRAASRMQTKLRQDSCLSLLVAAGIRCNGSCILRCLAATTATLLPWHVQQSRHMHASSNPLTPAQRSAASAARVRCRRSARAQCCRAGHPAGGTRDVPRKLSTAPHSS